MVWQRMERPDYATDGRISRIEKFRRQEQSILSTFLCYFPMAGTRIMFSFDEETIFMYFAERETAP